MADGIGEIRTQFRRAGGPPVQSSRYCVPIRVQALSRTGGKATTEPSPKAHLMNQHSHEPGAASARPVHRP